MIHWVAAHSNLPQRNCLISPAKPDRSQASPPRTDRRRQGQSIGASAAVRRSAQAEKDRTERTADVARARDTRVLEPKYMRMGYVAALAATNGLPKVERPQAMANYLRCSLADLERYEAAEAESTQTSTAEPSNIQRQRSSLTRTETPPRADQRDVPKKFQAPMAAREGGPGSSYHYGRAAICRRRA